MLHQSVTTFWKCKARGCGHRWQIDGAAPPARCPECDGRSVKNVGQATVAIGTLGFSLKTKAK